MINYARTLGLGFIGIGLVALSCAGVKEPPTATGAGGTGITGGGGTGGPIVVNPCTGGVCTDFPAVPQVSGSVPANTGQIFGTPGGGAGGPCIIEPPNEALFPNNWLRPRFRFSVPAGHGVFEIRVHADNQGNDLVVHTATPEWTMPKEMWYALASHTQDRPIQVTVRSAALGGGAVLASAPSTFTIAPVQATGKMVYWATSGTTYFNGQPTGSETLLSGFAVGDESVVEVLRPPQVLRGTVDQGINPRPVRCIGCHTSTPDGEFIAFNDFYPWGAMLASGNPMTLGQQPMYLGAGGAAAIVLPWVGMTTFSRGHWSATDRVMVAPLDSCGGMFCERGAGMDMAQQAGLAWFDLLSATATGVAPRDLKGTAWDWIYLPSPGSGQYAAAPSWSHDGSKILFTMTNAVKSGRLGTGVAHLATVPYSKTGVQTPTPLPGDGSIGTRAQYYGTYSGDDRLIAYNELSSSEAATAHPSQDSSNTSALEGMYSRPQTEVYVIRAEGGTKWRLKANDPPACAVQAGIQAASPGINNSWPKWSPAVQSSGGRSYYWLIFSSWREGRRYPTGGPIAQLYVTGVMTDETSVHTYPAIYLWNQPSGTSNHTPAWDIFQIPDVR